LPSSQAVSTVQRKNWEPSGRSKETAGAKVRRPLLIGGYCDERKLTRVWAGVRHREDSCAGVLEFEILIRELGAVDGL
jgi:hypothetical protein